MDDRLRQQRDHFDHHHREYASILFERDSAFHRAVTARMLEALDLRPGDRVLDLGCGQGRVALALLRAGCRVTGLDVSRGSLESLSERVEQLGCREAFEALCLPAEELDARGRYDAVIGRGILHHLERPVEVLERVHRALISGGRAVFLDPNPQQPLWIPLILLHPALSWSVERHVLRGTAENASGFLRRAGFEPVRHRFVGWVPPGWWDRWRAARLAESLLTSLPLIGRLALYLMVIGDKSG
ncbi:MAG: class I SAM-dependent methyltransferase [Deltaproteobacteria bacterium]|nr:class I SAM-dependent methyltransferase [Deltaproteobacteria bacterium]